MATAKKKNYIDAELDWAEIKLEEWKTYVDKNPIHQLKDRIEWKETKYGKVPQVIASIENQGKYIQDMMKNFLSLLAEVGKMREVEVQKQEAMGRGVVPSRMKKKTV